MTEDTSVNLKISEFRVYQRGGICAICLFCHFFGGGEGGGGKFELRLVRKDRL